MDQGLTISDDAGPQPDELLVLFRVMYRAWASICHIPRRAKKKTNSALVPHVFLPVPKTRAAPDTKSHVPLRVEKVDSLAPCVSRHAARDHDPAPNKEPSGIEPPDREPVFASLQLV